MPKTTVNWSRGSVGPSMPLSSVGSPGPRFSGAPPATSRLTLDVTVWNRSMSSALEVATTSMASSAGPPPWSEPGLCLPGWHRTGAPPVAGAARPRTAAGRATARAAPAPATAVPVRKARRANRGHQSAPTEKSLSWSGTRDDCSNTLSMAASELLPLDMC